jgi:uncharacterized radical SAM superfamily Fe-S cluster-containing enzyme
METIINRTQSLCPLCDKKVDANIVERDGKVFLEKLCLNDGRSYALVSSDADWYRSSLSFVKPMTPPKSRSVDSFRGCPESCGLCPEHGQHTCLPVIEVTSECDLDCPVCLKKWKEKRMMSADEFGSVIDTLKKCEGFVPVINISGGEPLVSPDIIAYLERAKDKGIMQCSISTNGLRLLRDKKLRDSLRSMNPLIALQFDGFRPATYEALRGRDLSGEKLEIVRILEDEGFLYSLVATVAHNVNLDETGDIADFFFRSKAHTLMFQPVAYTGNASSMRDPLVRATIPDIIKRVEGRTVAKKGDFVPLPCSHPTCFALSYYFQGDENTFMSVKDLMGLENYLNIISNRTLPGLDADGFRVIQNRVYDLWSAADQFPGSDTILTKIRTLLRELNEAGFSPDKAYDIGLRSVKAVFIHQFMDEDTIDFGRLNKCCNHYSLTDGRLVPMCAQNVLL